MSELIAACTPNSLPNEDGRVEHGYQITVLDQDMAVVATVDLPEWETFQPEEAVRKLTDGGFVLSDGTGGWMPSGLGHMAPVAYATEK